MQKVLIWDLGDTLITTDVLQFASEIGWLDFILYPILDGENPTKVYETALRLLHLADTSDQDACPEVFIRGIPAPPLLCQWLMGTLTPQQLWERIEHSLFRDPTIHFTSKRQERLVRNTLKILFSPDIFTNCIVPIETTVYLLNKCAQQYKNGVPSFRLFILSNWDPYSFQYLLRSPALEPIFQCFLTQNILISRHIGSLIPYPAIYEYLLTIFQLDHKNCILIDDQQENIITAQDYGMQGIQVNRKDYADLKYQLEEHNLL